MFPLVYTVNLAAQIRPHRRVAPQSGCWKNKETRTKQQTKKRLLDSLKPCSYKRAKFTHKLNCIAFILTTKNAVISLCYSHRRERRKDQIVGPVSPQHKEKGGEKVIRVETQ